MRGARRHVRAHKMRARVAQRAALRQEARYKSAEASDSMRERLFCHFSRRHYLAANKMPSPSLAVRLSHQMPGCLSPMPACRRRRAIICRYVYWPVAARLQGLLPLFAVAILSAAAHFISAGRWFSPPELRARRADATSCLATPRPSLLPPTYVALMPNAANMSLIILLRYYDAMFTEARHTAAFMLMHACCHDGASLMIL